VFETRDPARRQWKEWTREASWSRQDLPRLGVVESWYDLLEVDLPLVTFRGTTLLPDGTALTFESTLRFRDRAEVEAQLGEHGYQLVEVRGAPDRPGSEFVFIARSMQQPSEASRGQQPR